MRSNLLKIAGIALLVAFRFSCFADGQTPIAHQGLLDLRNQNLFDHHVALDGEWGFFWNQLLTPDSLLPGPPPAYAPYPVLWKDLRINDQSFPSLGYATYTLTVLLPAKRPRIGLEVPDTYCTFKLYVNGVVQIQNGLPATTKEKATPFWNGYPRLRHADRKFLACTGRPV
jgi:hypothetical protein